LPKQIKQALFCYPASRKTDRINGMKKAFFFLTIAILIFLVADRMETSQWKGSFFPTNLPAKTPGHSFPAPAPKTITIAAVGDLSLSREINWQIEQNDPAFLFQKIAGVISRADIATANLEGPVIENCPFARTGFKFCGQPDSVQGLVFAGFDLVNLANNHVANFGPSGIIQTKQSLKANKIDYFDSQITAYKQIDNTRIAFLGFDDIVRRIDPDQLIKAVTEADNQADIIIINFHWGAEYQTTPRPRQRSLAQSAISAGADVVIGHHPHVIQPLEYHQQKPIFYSLGNFVFDQLWSKPTRQGAIAQITIENKTVTSAKMIPIYINNAYQPEITDENLD